MLVFVCGDCGAGQARRDASAPQGAIKELELEVILPGKNEWVNAATSRNGTVLIKKNRDSVLVSRGIASPPPPRKDNFTLNTLVDHFVDMNPHYTAGVDVRVRVRQVGENTWTELVWDRTKKRQRGRQGGWTGLPAFD
jgi:hypothetical protein